MSKTFKMIRLVGTSSESYEAAIQSAIHDAKESLKGLNWFQVVEYRGHIGEDGSVNEWQVVIDVAFKILRT
jgi:flavin-binding protein dodecin